MIRETIAADLLGPLAPLLASLLVALAFLPAVEALRLRLPPSVRGARSTSSRRRPSASPPGAGLSWAAGSTRRDPALLLGETPTGFPFPLLAVRRPKARPS